MPFILHYGDFPYDSCPVRVFETKGNSRGRVSESFTIWAGTVSVFYPPDVGWGGPIISSQRGKKCGMKTAGDKPEGTGRGRNNTGKHRANRKVGQQRRNRGFII